MATIKELKAISILSVANQLGMSLNKIGRNTYSWQDHDSFVINARDNYFNWFSRSTGGDVIRMVQLVKEELSGEKVSFKQAKHFLENGEFEAVEVIGSSDDKEPFNYYLERYETSFKEARDYLTQQRQLSEETIDFFLSQGVMAQATKKTGEYYEPVIVFKSLNRQKKLSGACLQGIKVNNDLYEKGRLKQIMRGSDGTLGMSVDIGKPKRLVFAEAPIDLMSYYELHKDILRDVRLVAMNGLKESLISRHVVDLFFETGVISGKMEQDKIPVFLADMAQVSTFFKEDRHQDLITLAVDNDEAGRTFIARLEEKGIGFTRALPPKENEQMKMDWNDYLKETIRSGALKEVVEPLNKEELERDTDGDGLSDELERTIGTDPYSVDTDGDGKSDHEEVSYGSDPRQIKKDPLKGQIKSNAGEFHRTSDYSREISLRSASKPVADEPQPDFPVIAQLNFTTNNAYVSTKKPNYHVVTPVELKRLNRFAPTIQFAAQWYLKELADRDFYYVFSNRQGGEEVLKVTFQKKNFAHLIGVSPVNKSMSETVEDLAYGRGEFDNLQISNAIQDKMKILPLLPEILDTEMILFNNLSMIAKFNDLDLSKAINPNNSELLMLFKNIDQEGIIPASLMRVKGGLQGKLQEIEKNIVLGIYREKDGRLESVDINKSYVKDGGTQMLDMLNELINKSPEKTMSELFGEAFKKGYKDYIKPLVESVKKIIDDSPSQENIPEEEVEMTDHAIEKQQPPITEHSAATELTNDEPLTKKDHRTLSEIIEAKDTKGLAALLKEGVKEYFQSDMYKQFLLTMSKFYNYSPRNIQMILKQKPDAQAVASFKKWKKEFERHVKKGEQAIRIFAPIIVKQKDPKTGEVLLDDEGKEITYTAYKLVPVFDVSQTSGKELTKAVYELEGSYEDFAKLYKAIKDVASSKGISITFSDQIQNANGYYSLSENKIVIKKGLSEQQTLKTIFHEMAHADLHNSDNIQGMQLTKSTAELQAESVAFVVSSHYGIDTSEYSFGYLASWTQDPVGLSDLENQLKIVQKEASNLINRIDGTLEKLKTKEVTKDVFAEKINRLKEQSEQEKIKGSDAPKKALSSDKNIMI